ncbi:MAG TPA: hypothetical protein VL985_08765 [Stellaceae bacterium]|nr:hypothetical protein [Stellaceae bacterium]
MRPLTAGTFAAIAALAVAATAEAETIPITMVTPAELLADFNVIVQNNLSNSNEIKGPALVGCPPAGCEAIQGLYSTGPLNRNSVVLGTTPGTTGITGYGEVNVFSNVLAGTNASVNGSVTYVGGAVDGNGKLSNSGTGSVLASHVFPIGTSSANNPATFQNFIWAPLTGLSRSLATLTPNSELLGTTFTPGMAVTGATPAVFSISLETLNSLTGTLTFAGCLGARTCDGVIDVTGAGTLTQGFAFPLVRGFTNILLNFDDAVTVDVGNVWTASILDPLGSVIGTHEIDGDVVAMSYSSTDETLFSPFSCSDNLCGMTAPPLRVDEPRPLPLFGAAVGALAACAAIRHRARA